jgi:hemerythrin-like domain-containing protein
MDARRAVAVADYVRDWAHSVHHHHSVEDEIHWPVLVESAGPHVDLTELSDDHAALDPMLGRLRTAADAHRARPDEDTATALATCLAELRDTFAEHSDRRRRRCSR